MLNLGINKKQHCNAIANTEYKMVYIQTKFMTVYANYMRQVAQRCKRTPDYVRNISKIRMHNVYKFNSRSIRIRYSLQRNQTRLHDYRSQK